MANLIYTNINANGRKLFMAAIALAIWASVGILFYFTASSHPADRTMPGVTIQFFSYFTVISNLMAALCLTVLLFAPTSAMGNFFGRLSIITAITVYVTFVGIAYALLLSDLWRPTRGLSMVSNEVLHTVAPLAFLLFWLFFINKKGLQWNDALRWLWLPALYIVYIALRGLLTGIYPYPFIDLDNLPLIKALINTIILLMAFLMFGTILIFIGKSMAEKQR